MVIEECAHAHNKHSCKLYTNDTTRVVDMVIEECAHAHNKHSCKLYTNDTTRVVGMVIEDWPQPRSWRTWPSEKNVYFSIYLPNPILYLGIPCALVKLME
jgi:hypothetical protein